MSKRSAMSRDFAKELARFERAPPGIGFEYGAPRKRAAEAQKRGSNISEIPKK